MPYDKAQDDRQDYNYNSDQEKAPEELEKRPPKISEIIKLIRHVNLLSPAAPGSPWRWARAPGR